MNKFKEFKQKVKENKGKIITGILVIGGVAFVITKQNSIIKQLKISDAEQTEEIFKQSAKITKLTNDIDLLKSVMSENVVSSIKAGLTRSLRYHEGRLKNGLCDGVMSEADKLLRMENIEFYSNELEKIIKAEELLK